MIYVCLYVSVLTGWKYAYMIFVCRYVTRGWTYAYVIYVCLYASLLTGLDICVHDICMLASQCSHGAGHNYAYMINVCLYVTTGWTYEYMIYVCLYVNIFTGLNICVYDLCMPVREFSHEAGHMRT